MQVSDFLAALIAGDALRARASLQELVHDRLQWDRVDRPALAGNDLAIAAAVIELLALRSGLNPPQWTSSVSAADEDVFLVRAALTMPRLRRLCIEEGPEPLRRRRIFAPPDFLTFA